MYVGVQGIGTSKMELEFLRRHGVTHMDSDPDPGNLDEIVRERETATAAGVDLEMIHIPFAESIPLALDPQRDRDIDTMCGWIENAGKAGLRGLNYNFSTVGYQRTETRYGRGGSGYSSFEFSELVDSPYHGFNFCCGVAAEGLEDPGKELPPIVEYFSQRKKIFNVHFRNIRGLLNDFVEVWPDEGDVDMHELAQIFHRTDYPYMLMPDHAPLHPDDMAPEGVSGRVRQGWAFQFGYIKALIQAVNKEASKSSS